MLKSKLSKEECFYKTYWEEKRFINIIYWGRIDYKNKGLIISLKYLIHLLKNIQKLKSEFILWDLITTT